MSAASRSSWQRNAGAAPGAGGGEQPQRDAPRRAVVVGRVVLQHREPRAGARGRRVVAGRPARAVVAEPRLRAVVAAADAVQREADRARLVRRDVAAEQELAVADPRRRDQARLAQRLAGELESGRARGRPQRRRVAVDHLVVGDPRAVGRDPHVRRRLRRDVLGRGWSPRSGSARRAACRRVLSRCRRPVSSEATIVPSSAADGHSYRNSPLVTGRCPLPSGAIRQTSVAAPEDDRVGARARRSDEHGQNDGEGDPHRRRSYSNRHDTVRVT